MVLTKRAPNRVQKRKKEKSSGGAKTTSVFEKSDRPSLMDAPDSHKSSRATTMATTIQVLRLDPNVSEIVGKHEKWLLSTTLHPSTPGIKTHSRKEGMKSYGERLAQSF